MTTFSQLQNVSGSEEVPHQSSEEEIKLLENRSAAQINHGDGGDKILIGDITDSSSVIIDKKVAAKQSPIILGPVTGNVNTVYAQTYIATTESRASLHKPHTLIAPSHIFEGRQLEIEQLLTHLHQDNSVSLPIAGIRGMGGVGKTELALQIAHRLTSQYPDAQLLIECQPNEQPYTAEELVGRIIHSLVPDYDLPDSVGERLIVARQVMTLISLVFQ